jgi:hypothetical protein
VSRLAGLLEGKTRIADGDLLGDAEVTHVNKE